MGKPNNFTFSVHNKGSKSWACSGKAIDVKMPKTELEIFHSPRNELREELEKFKLHLCPSIEKMLEKFNKKGILEKGEYKLELNKVFYPEIVFYLKKGEIFRSYFIAAESYVKPSD